MSKKRHIMAFFKKLTKKVKKTINLILCLNVDKKTLKKLFTTIDMVWKSFGFLKSFLLFILRLKKWCLEKKMMCRN